MSEQTGLHAQLTDILEGWPIGEPCQEISRQEAIELARFVMDCFTRRGLKVAGLADPAGFDW